MPNSDEHAEPLYIHATAFVVGEYGILVRGVSGAGKSSLADRAISEARHKGLFAALVGDDRIAIEAKSGRIILRPHPLLAGLIERRGLGIQPINTIPAARLSGIVDLTQDPLERYPSEDQQSARLLALYFPRLIVSKSEVDETTHTLFWAWLTNLAQYAQREVHPPLDKSI